MLKNGKPFLSVGSPGATRIICPDQIIVNVVDFR
jgi:gamma-glutamyltranspeptidase